MTRPDHDYPQNLRWQAMLRFTVLNQVLVLVGALSMHAAETFGHPGAQTLGLPYHFMWMQCIGLFGLILQGGGILLVARRGWRQTPDAQARYERLGLFQCLPAHLQWQLAGVSLMAIVVAPWLALNTAEWLIRALDVPWLPPVKPPYHIGMFNMIYGTVLIYTHEYFQNRSVLSEMRERKAQQLSDQAQLNLLRSQLEPHMLFNTLSNLYELIDESPEQARSMLSHLIGFLRSTLAGSRVSQHALVDEFKLASDYLALMEIRMGERLQVSLSLPVALESTMVPAMLLQPLVENAIKHGLEQSKEGGQLHISAGVQSGELVLQVTNSGTVHQGGSSTHAWMPESTPEPGSGFGLQYVRDRLNTLYGQTASVDFKPLPAQNLTQVTLRIPLSKNPIHRVAA